MKSVKRVLCSLMLLLAVLLPSFQSLAVGDEEIYLIHGYNDINIISLKQDGGNVVIPGYGFCLDAKAHTPGYTDSFDNEIHYTISVGRSDQ